MTRTGRGRGTVQHGWRWAAVLVLLALVAFVHTALVQQSLDGQVRGLTLSRDASLQRIRAGQLVDTMARLADPGASITRDRAHLRMLLGEFQDGHEALVAMPPASHEVPSLLAASDGPAGALGSTARSLDEHLATSGRWVPALDGLVDQAADANGEYAAAMDGVATAVSGRALDRTATVRRLGWLGLSSVVLVLGVVGAVALRPGRRGDRRGAGPRTRRALGVSHRDLQLLAQHDPLTGLANRALFRDRLDHAIASAGRTGRQVGLMFLDLDRFKEVNDQFGHDAGDELLVEVADRLRQVSRRADTVARMGGDEFTLVLEGLTGADGVTSVAIKILKLLEEPIAVAGRETRVTTSIGIALYPDDALTSDELLTHADAAMYAAKNAGRNTFQFSTTELREASVARLALIEELRTALDEGDLRLAYQPQFEVASGRVVGVEALVRWRHPDGERAARDFISIAEDTDVIGPLCTWVIREACLQARSWQQDGLPSLVVAVNLSPRQFEDSQLPTYVAAALEESGMSPEQLELEITEAALTADVQRSRAILRLLKGIGVRVVIDDFGTGFSSLRSLTGFPIDALKIDESFLADGSPGTVASAVFSFAEHLGMETVAEGVERHDQLDLLRRLGCQRAQGFLLSPPVASHEVTALVRRGVGLPAADAEEAVGGQPAL